MKVTDLMVGDYVCLDGDVNYDNPIRIQQICYQGENDIIADSDVFGVEDIIPIPLTEEILVKNGFEKNYNDDAPVEECYFYRLFAKPRGWLDIDAFGLEEELGAEFTYHDINVNYVHQLQHLLRLAGIQKEIEL